ncbi:MAG: hypothetical protein HY321_12125 [Armatimonadetes bacterium]|nr:hypothetical protein [Armatimonadota bacterium]
MMRLTLCACAMMLALESGSAEPAAVGVLDGPETQPMRDGLQRVGVPVSGLKALDAASLAGCRVLVISGTEPPVKESDKPAIERFLEGGGSVLGVGRAAGRLIDLGLFDAETYTMTGTTVHMTVFDGYHRLTFGYPGAEPMGGWSSGVPHLLRATQGPFMKLGPAATSILIAGGPYSLAAFQRRGKGMLLLIGADPQGGQLFTEVDQSKPMPGSEIKTDGVLANAVAFLLDRRCNLIPNSGFEEFADLPPAQSNWSVETRGGAKSEWSKEGAPEGQTFLKLTSPEAGASADARPSCPIVVERGETYAFACRYRSTVPWKVAWQQYKTSGRDPEAEAGPTREVPASAEWTRFEVKIAVPPDVAYVRPVLTLAGAGELCVDAVTLCLDEGAQ